MKTPIFVTSAITAAALCLLPFWQCNLAFAGPQEKKNITDEVYHQEKAAQYRQEAEQLQQAIQRYQIMEEIYQKGSRGISPGFNSLGRRDMVERVKRTVHYFTREAREFEQRAAEEEQLAQRSQRE